MSRFIGLLLLVAIVVVARSGTAREQTISVDLGVACVWFVFFFLGVKALLVRKQVRGQIHDPRLFALAARPQEEWLGLVLAIVGVLILAFGGFTIAGTRQDWSALGGILMFIAWYLIWRGGYAICLDGALHYSSLFGGYRQVRFEDIGSARLIVGVHPTRPTVRLEIYPASEENPIVINRAIFKRADIESVLKWLGAKLRGGAGVPQ
jgi:hypothetical protein